ncbi:hypothetical protein QA596_07285 [Balneolales bacterium ANBcel1]|nr:hypothetical protein [Balneolales bacterium ANBcel1]
MPTEPATAVETALQFNFFPRIAYNENMQFFVPLRIVNPLVSGLSDVLTALFFTPALISQQQDKST